MSKSIRRLVAAVVVVVAVAGLLALAVPQLWYPLWFDQGAFAACADVLRRGGALYRDCFEVRGPAAILAYAIPLAISPSPVAIHVFDLVWQALTALLLASLVRRLFGIRAAVAAAVLYWLMYAGINYWATAQAEGFANLFFVLALYAGWMAVGEYETRRPAAGEQPQQAWQPRGAEDEELDDSGQDAADEGHPAWYAHHSEYADETATDDNDDDADLLPQTANRSSAVSPAAWLAISGACIGALFWFKYPFVLVGLVPAGLILAQTVQRRRTKTAARSPIAVLQSLLPFLLGGLAALLFGLALFALSGSIDSLWSQIAYDVATFNNVPLAERLVWLRTTYWEEIVAFVAGGNTPTAGFKDTVPQLTILGRGYPFIFALMLVGFVAGVWRRHTRAAALYGLGYFAAGIAISLWQGHFYRYHFLIILPAMAMLAAAAVAEKGIEGRDSRLADAQSPILDSQSLPSKLQSLFAYLLLAAAVIGTAATMVPWAVDAYNNAVIQGKTAAALYQESRLAPYSLLAAELVQRTAPRDHIVIFSDVPAVYALTQRPNGTRFPYLRWAQESGSAALRAEFERQFLDDLTRNRARIFVLTRPDFPWTGADFISLWKSMPAIHNYVESHYHYVGENGPFLIFQRSVR